MPKELPDLAIEKYPLDSAFKKEDKPVQAPVQILDQPRVTPILQPPQTVQNIKVEEPKKPVSPPPLPQVEDSQVNNPIRKTAPIPSDFVSNNSEEEYYDNLKGVARHYPKTKYQDVSFEEFDNDELSSRRELKNGFFSTIKEKIQNKEYHDILSDPKIVLYELRNHHDSISEREKMLKEKSLLDSRLAEKIMLLELLEEGWYLLRKEIETKQILLLEKERLIDKMTFELKNLMNQSNDFDRGFRNPKTSVKSDYNISEDKWFVLRNGKRLSSISELKDILRNMDDETYSHHVTLHKNDFASWIKHVFLNDALADKILRANSRNEIISILETDS